MGCVYSMVIRSEFRRGQCRDGNHDAAHFTYKSTHPFCFQNGAQENNCKCYSYSHLFKIQMRISFSVKKVSCFPLKMLTWTESDGFWIELTIIIMYFHFKLRQVSRLLYIVDRETDLTFWIELCLCRAIIFKDSEKHFIINRVNSEKTSISEMNPMN